MWPPIFMTGCSASAVSPPPPPRPRPLPPAGCCDQTTVPVRNNAAAVSVARTLEIFMFGLTIFHHAIQVNRWDCPRHLLSQRGSGEFHAAFDLRLARAACRERVVAIDVTPDRVLPVAHQL